MMQQFGMLSRSFGKCPPCLPRHTSNSQMATRDRLPRCRATHQMHQLNRQLAERAGEHRERELLERIDARDREAMRELYLVYHPRLALFLRRRRRRPVLGAVLEMSTPSVSCQR